MKQRDFKRCPRCDHKTPIYQDRCDNCGLIFSRLSKATNSAAKKALKNKEYNKVICDKVLPRDVKKWPLFWVALFFGWFGLHYAKVGRYKMFTYLVIATALLFIACFLPMSWFNREYLVLLMWSLILPASFGTIIWVVSIFQILLNRFKVPISIDEELVKEELDPEIVNEILTNVKEDKKEVEKEEVVQSNKKQKKQRIKIVCASCGAFVKVDVDEKICPKCDETLYGD